MIAPPRPSRSAWPSRPLRIGIEAHVVGRRQTGNERVVSNLIDAIHRGSPHRLVVYFTEPSTADRWRRRADHRLEVRLLRARHPLVRIPLALPYRAARDRLDVLLSHDNCPPVAPCPVVTLVHDVAFARYPEFFSRYERLWMNRTIPLSMRRSRGIVTVSGFTRDEIVRLYRVPSDRITVAHNGVDPVFRDPSERVSPVEPPFFLAVGNLQPRKNLATLLAGYARLLDEHPETAERLVIVGQERLEAERLYREAASLREAGRVVFTGYIDDQALVGLFQRATAFAYPSVYEGFGLPPVEAMAAGTPAIVSDIPVMREVVGDAALRLPATDVPAWAAALHRVAVDEGLRDRLRREGRARSERYTWEDSAARVVGALERAARPGRR